MIIVVRLNGIITFVSFGIIQGIGKAYWLIHMQNHCMTIMMVVLLVGFEGRKPLFFPYV